MTSVEKQNRFKSFIDHVVTKGITCIFFTELAELLDDISHYIDQMENNGFLKATYEEMSSYGN